MSTIELRKRLLFCAAGIALGALTPVVPAAADPAPMSPLPASGASTKEVLLCDNKTKVTIAANTAPTRANGQRIAAALMAQWQQTNPATAKDWLAEENEKHEVPPPVDNRGLIGNGQNSTYGRVTAREVEMWNRETYAFAVRGSTIFHSATELGSEIGVSCDMCHPRAANTHPETYPKFQEQLGKVALLRDMINWCIEHPVRGKRLAEDAPKLRALEAYILAQRKGMPLAYGKH